MLSVSLRLRLIGGSSDASEVDVPALVSALGGAGNRARGGRGKGGGGGGKSVWSKLLLLSLRLSKTGGHATDKWAGRAHCLL